MKHPLVWELLLLGTLVVFMSGCTPLEMRQADIGQYQQEVVTSASQTPPISEQVAQPSDSTSTYQGSTVVEIRERSGSSGSSKDRDGEVSVDLDVPDQYVEKDSGLNNNLVDLFAFTTDGRAVLNKLTFTLTSQSNTNTVKCSIDFGRYVDCTPVAGQIGFSQIQVTVSDGSASYTDLFVVTVLGEGEVASVPEPAQEQNNSQQQPAQQLPAQQPASNSAPTLQVINSQTATVGQPFSLITSASDADGDSLAFSDDSGIFAISSAGVIQFTPTSDQVGVTSVSVTVSDGQASTSRTFQLAIVKPQPVSPPAGSANNAPTIASIATQVAEVGKHFDLTIAGSDPDGDRLTYSDNTGLFAINPATGVISFIPAAGQVGSQSIRITVSDGSLSASMSFGLIIQAASTPPPPPEPSQSPFGSVTPVNTWRSYFGSLTIAGQDAEPGDEVGVFDPSGTLAGKYIVLTAGQYGFLHVYGDDASTSGDEGAAAGEQLTFKVWDKSTGTTFTFGTTAAWQGDMERINFGISVS